MRRRCPGLKHTTEASGSRERAVEEHSALAEAGPGGLVDGAVERMPV